MPLIRSQKAKPPRLSAFLTSNYLGLASRSDRYKSLDRLYRTLYPGRGSKGAHVEGFFVLVSEGRATRWLLGHRVIAWACAQALDRDHAQEGKDIGWRVREGPATFALILFPALAFGQSARLTDQEVAAR